MREKLESVAARFAEIEKALAMAPSDMEEYKRLMKERKELAPVCGEYAVYKKAEADLEEAKSIIASGDKEMLPLAEEEKEDAEKRLSASEEKLKELLLPKDENDDKNVIVEIRAGVGGDEAALFAASLYRMYSMYAAGKGFTIEPIYENATELGGYKEISFMLLGKGAYSRLKYESGGHRVQRVPETEAGGRIHTSTVTVAVLPEAEEVDFKIDPAEIQIDTFRSSGAGGQKVNKTESAIRVTHLPTGTVVECQDERSQYKNKEKALRVLRSKICEKLQSEADERLAETRRGQVGTGKRSEKIRTYNFPQDRVTDHRIGLTLYRIESFMNGDLDEMIDALSAAERLEKLKAEE